MQEREPRQDTMLGLDDLDDVAGGVTVTFPRSGKTQTYNVVCPKCGSGNIVGFPGDTNFESHEEFVDFFHTHLLLCESCNFGGRGRRFKVDRA